jgi:hypothetical protein
MCFILKMASRQLKEKGWRPSATQFGLGLAGLGGLVYGTQKIYKAYDKYNFVKEAAAAMNSNATSPILQMIPI